IFQKSTPSFCFFLDFLKPHYDWPIGLSTIQITSVLGLIYYSFILTKNHLQTKKLQPSYD
ncbi:MAG: diacylglyceryl transferase, partial [Bacteroidota bacterium]